MDRIYKSLYGRILAVIWSMKKARIYQRHNNIKQKLTNNKKIRLPEVPKELNFVRRVRHVDILLPKIFTLAPEDLQKNLQ